MSEFEEWVKLEELIRKCARCELYKSRTNVVVGGGNRKAKIILIGEAPGYFEDIKGEPFVGKAGMFLNECLRCAGLSRNDVYITNVVKCRPPNNRTPKPEEIKACSIYLEKQLELIKPKVIICLGNVAIKYIFRKYGLKIEPISKIHGRVYEVFGTYIIPMFHPAAALYNANFKQVILEDWKKLRNFLKKYKNGS